MSKPYPWAKPLRLTTAEAHDVYEIEDKIKVLLEDLSLELENHVEGGKWDTVVPYMLFCFLESFSHESSIAAALGYLQFVREGDVQNEVVRDSLKGLKLPKEPG